MFSPPEFNNSACSKVPDLNVAGAFGPGEFEKNETPPSIAVARSSPE
jgi:hypothetical protein